MTKEEFMRTYFAGIYTASDNTIKIFTNKDEQGNNIFEYDLTDEEIINNFLHELIHALTSTVQEDKSVFEGINIRLPNGENSIFLGINEGITQMITDNLLGKESDAYPFETTFAKQLALIIGEDKLLAIYSSNNPQLLIDEINKIGSVDAATLCHEILLFQMVTKGELDDDGFNLGFVIQRHLMMLYEDSGVKMDDEFESLLLNSEKVKNYMQYIPAQYPSVDYLGFSGIDILEKKFKERKK